MPAAIRHAALIHAFLNDRSAKAQSAVAASRSRSFTQPLDNGT